MRRAASGHDAFYENHVRFVDPVSEGALGGGRFAAVKKRQQRNPVR
jgi:hypothetical protein